MNKWLLAAKKGLVTNREVRYLFAMRKRSNPAALRVGPHFRLPLRRDRSAAFSKPPSRTDPNAASATTLGLEQDECIALERRILDRSSREARHRYARGLLALALTRKRGWTELGFVRLGDYCRERLGVAGRTLEEDARVAEAFARLPSLASVFLAGRLSWTKVRLLCSVATLEDIDGWLDLAAALDARELAKTVSDRRKPQPPAEDDEELPLVGASRKTDFSVRVTREGRRFWRVACELAERSAGSSLSQAQVLELVVAEASSGVDLAAGRAERIREAPALEGQVLGRAAPRRCNDAAGRNVPPDDASIASSFELDARLREVQSALRRIDSELGPLLCEALDRKLHRHSGFARFSDYCEARLDVAARKAWNLIAIERAIQRGVPSLSDAYRDGRLTYLAALVVLPVLRGPHSAAWIERATTVTLRRLESEVAWALQKEDAAGAGESNDAPAPPDSDRDLMRELLSAVEASRVQMRAHGEAVERETASEIGSVLRFRIDPELAELAEQTMRALRRGNESRSAAFERMVALALCEWMATPRHRDPIFERDGWRCAVPGCRSRRNLQDHHIRFRSRGGGHAKSNRVTLCAAHHLHGIHAGRLRACGRAPFDIVWELGCRSGDGEPLMRFVGERYVKGR